MSEFVIAFMIVAAVFALATLIYVPVDLVFEAKNKKKSEEIKKEEPPAPPPGLL